MKRGADQTSISSFFGTLSKRQAIETSDGKPATNSPKSTKHRDAFYKPWLQKYTWIVHEDDEGMFCALCTKHKQLPRNGSTSWIKTPCQSYREDAIRRHQDSTCHRVAVDLEANRMVTKKSGGIQQAMQEAVTLEDQAFMASLRCMYFLIRKELPHTTNFGDLLDLAQDIGCSYLDAVRGDHETQKKYQSYRTMQEMVWCLGETVREEIITDLRQSPFFSVLIDETTDVAVLKQLIVYVKYIKGNTMETKFLTIEDLVDGKADTIVQKLKDVFRDIEVPLPGRLSALGSDGAAVMVGCKNGVSTQLRKESSILVNNHCVAHRLALAVRQTADHMPELKRFNKHLQDLFFFYENSPVRLAALREIQKSTEDPVLKPTQPKAMRWLSHDHACATLRQILPSIMMSLEQEAQERHDSLALGLAKNIQTVQFIYILHMMCDILPQLSTLSKCFQGSGMDFGQVQEYLETTLDHLDARLTTPGRHFKAAPELIEDLEVHFKITRKGISDIGVFKQKTLLDQYADVVDADSTRLEYQSFRMCLWEHRDKDISFMVSKLLQEEMLFPNLRNL